MAAPQTMASPTKRSPGRTEVGNASSQAVYFFRSAWGGSAILNRGFRGRSLRGHECQVMLGDLNPRFVFGAFRSRQATFQKLACLTLFSAFRVNRSQVAREEPLQDLVLVVSRNLKRFKKMLLRLVPTFERGFN